MLLDFLFPRRCLSCREFLSPSDRCLCDRCEALWPLLSPPFCKLCSYPFSSPETTSHLCGDCLQEGRSYKKVYAAGLYEGLLLEMIVRMKYRGEERLTSFLGRRLAERIEEDFDLIIPIPLHARRLRERGYNQSLLLAREIGKVLRRPVDPFLMIKERNTLPQMSLKGEERRKNLRGVFGVKRPDKIKDKNILLVDDVFTTGTTMEMASRELLKAGATEIKAGILARAH